MKRRIVSMALAVALLCGLAIAGTAFASAPVTLYTGGGTIYATDWTDKGNGVYEGGGTLPMPIMPGATFEGWYTDIGLSTGQVLAGSEATASAYYAKWTLVNSDDNDKMAYFLTNDGGSAYGFKNGEKLKAFFVHGGFYTATADTPPSPGGTADYSGTKFSFGLSAFTKREDTDVYLARTMNLEGNFVRLSYHVQNRGSANSGSFWLGAAADSMLGENDKVPLKKVSSGGQTWLSMVDQAAGNELRLYTTAASVTTPDRIWWGGFQPRGNNNGIGFRGNTFNSGQDEKYRDGIDSAFAFSWNVPGLKPGETKSYSVLLGVGSSSGFNTAYKLSYDLNGASGTTPTDSNRYPMGAQVTVTSTTPTRTGYSFVCWSTVPDGNGASARAGGKLPIYGDMTLYAIWAPIPYELELTVTEDEQPITDGRVTLWQKGRQKLELTHDGAGVYSTHAFYGSYDVYVDGVKYSQAVTVSGDSTAAVAFQTATVNLTLDGNHWSGRSVSLWQDDVKAYDLSEVTGGYQKGLLESGTYDIYLDGADTGETVTVGTPETLAYHTADVTVTKDGKVWADSEVKVGDFTAALTGGRYIAIVPAGDYDVTVNATEVGALENYTLAAAFFTVTFYDGTVPYGASSPQKPQVILSGSKATAPDATQPPAHSGGTAVFDGWRTTDGGTTDFDFDNTAITATTKVYVSWSTPVVVPGEPARQSNTTYKLPNLKITGYSAGQKINGYSITITGGGSVNTPSAAWGTPKTIAEAEAALQALVFTVGSSEQTVTITVYGA